MSRYSCGEREREDGVSVCEEGGRERGEKEGKDMEDERKAGRVLKTERKG